MKCSYNSFLFVLIIFILYFCCFFNIYSACLFESSNFTASSMIIKCNNCDIRFVFLLSAKPFHIYKQKIIILVPNLKQKCLSELIFYKFRSKKITSSGVILSFSHSSFKLLSINLFVSRNVLLTVFKTSKATFSHFLSINTRVFFNFLLSCAMFKMF